ncbi:MAG: archease [Candidatus Woesearchaeota archaeon]|jgi:SHS2 domain-containing protein
MTKKTSSKNIAYEFLEHTADVKFKAYGATFENALKNAVKATIDVMTDVTKIKATSRKKILVNANTKESLIYDFLEEIIYLIDTEGFLPCNVTNLEIITTNPNYKFILTAELEGDFAKNYDVHTYIKAVTYNDMEIIETKNQVTIQVVHDI